MKKMFCFIAVTLMAAPAIAQPTVDGTLDGSYGSALAVQGVQTSFGDNTDPSGFGGGGELNAGYATISNGRLFVMLTGNIESNFNKVSVFIDSVAGGENTLSGTPAYDFGNVSQNFGGYTFDNGFDADYHLYGRWGGGAFELDVVDRAGGTSAMVNGNGAAATSGGGTGVQSGSIGTGDVTTGAAGGFLTSSVDFGFNNTNVAGVSGGTMAAAAGVAEAVTTGLEFSISLADLGNPGIGDEIRIHAAYGNGDNNFHSNQILGSLAAPQGSLGGDGAGNFTGNLGGIDFNNFAGNQYFSITVVPEPSAMLVLGCAAFGLVRRRRA